MKKKKDINLILKIAKGIKEPINRYSVPEYLRENTVTWEAEAGSHSEFVRAKKVTRINGDGKLSIIKPDERGFCEMPFSGLNSNLEYIPLIKALEENYKLDKIRVEIATTMDKKEIDLLKILEKKTFFHRIFRKKKGKYFIFIKRHISKEIAKLMGCPKKEIIRATIVCPAPILKEDTKKLAYGVFGYESYIMALVEE